MTALSVFIWDLDGTLYAPDRRMHDAIRKAEIRVITDHTDLTFQEAEARFYSVYKSQTPSGTAASALIAGIPVPQAALEMERHFNRSDFLGRDDRLVRMFSVLTGFRHYIFSNGAVDGIVATIRTLGLSPDRFDEIVTSEKVGVNKPDTDGFRYILKATGLAPGAHVMVGDRDAVDIVPAKQVGMQTCLVWAGIGAETVADFRAATVYDVPSAVGIGKRR